MPRPAVPYDTVRSFIEEHLAANRKPPTIAAIITEVGGSATTIARYKRRWQSESESGGEGDGAQGLPPELTRSVLRGCESYWEELLAAVARREADVEAEAASRIAAAQSSADEAARAAGDLRNERDRTAEELARTAHRLEDAHRQLQARDRELAELQRREAAAGARIESLQAVVEDHRSRLAAVVRREERTRVELTASLEAAAERAARAEDAQARAARVERQAAASARAALRTELDELRGVCAAREAAIEALDRNASLGLQALRRTERSLRVAERRGARAEGELAAARREIEALNAQLAQVEGEHSAERAAWQGAREAQREKELALALAIAESRSKLASLRRASLSSRDGG